MEPALFSLEFARELLPVLGRGALISLVIAVASFLVAMALGGVFLLMRKSPIRAVSFVGDQVVEFFRLTPLLIHVYFLFFVLPEAGLTLGPITTGIVALGVYHGTYFSEIYRTALASVPRGQWDALDALRMTRLQGLRLVVLPQLAPLLIAMLGNSFIFILKDTAVLAAISVPELMFAANDAGSAVFRYIEPMLMAGLAYLVMSLAFAALIAVLSRHFTIRRSYDQF